MFTKVVDSIKQWWTDHGTKILGFVVSLVSALNVLPDMAAFPKFKLTVAIVGIVLGLITVNRGFVNSANLRNVG